MRKNWLATFIVILSAACIACIAAIINGYPFVYPDTGTYLQSGFEAEPPYDRTIFYGLFARHVSLYFSLWLVVIVQALIISYLLYLFTGLFFKGIRRKVLLLSTVIVLTGCTQFAFDVGYILPDIFTAITWICLALLLLHTFLSKSEIVIVSIIFCFSIATQVSTFSTLLISLVTLGIFIFFQRIRKHSSFIALRRYWLACGLLLLTWLVVPATHFLLGGKFSVSNGTHVFVMNHFLETGILKKYLEENCRKDSLKICRYKDSLGKNLMWEINGPLYKTGGWEANRNEYNKIIRNILTTPAYAKEVFQAGITSSVKQLTHYNVTIAIPQLEGTAPYGQIEWRYKKELSAYRASLQNTDHLNLEMINRIQSWLIPCSVIILIIAFALRRRLNLPPALTWCILVLFIYCICNSFISANFSTIDDRYMHRIAWLLPLLAVIVVWEFICGLGMRRV